jgi:predicted dehydrogenase
VRTKKIRSGILATGAIASVFTEDLLTLADAEVAAVESRTKESARAFADRYGMLRAHSSWAGLAADGDVDIVYIATPLARRCCARSRSPWTPRRPKTS